MTFTAAQSPLQNRREFLSQATGMALAGLTLSKFKAEAEPSASVINVPTQPSQVSIIPGDRRFFIKERLPDNTLRPIRPYTVRGVNWSPASVATDPVSNPNVFQTEFENWYLTDLPLMAQMGVNTIRVYHDFGTGTAAFNILDECYRQGIKVIMMTDSPRYGVIADSANIQTVVSAYKNHPAILMWAVGNEWDLPNNLGLYYYGAFATFPEAANFIQSSAQLIHSLDNTHPVTTFCADPHLPGIHPLSYSEFPYGGGTTSMEILANSTISEIDAWSFNVYRGASFGELFPMWRSISTKPMLIGEFGADALDHRLLSPAENQQMQADWDTRLWDEIIFNLAAERNGGICSGCLGFEWNDEFYKNGSPGSHTISYESNGGQPDGFNDEEWFGVVDIARNPRQVYYALRDRFAGGANAAQLSSQPIVRVESGGYSSGGGVFKIDAITQFYRSGGAGGGRGINVGVFDANTGIRLLDARCFDTYASKDNFTNLSSYLNSIPNGSIVMLAVGDEGGITPYGGTQPWGDSRVLSALSLLESLGSQNIREVGYNGSWAMLTRKGYGKLGEAFMNPATSGAPSSTFIEVPVALTLDREADRRQAPRIIGIPGTQNSWTLTVEDDPLSGPLQIDFSGNLQNPWQRAKTDLSQSISGQTSWADNGSSTGIHPSLVDKRFYRVSRQYP